MKAFLKILPMAIVASSVMPNVSHSGQSTPLDLPWAAKTTSSPATTKPSSAAMSVHAPSPSAAKAVASKSIGGARITPAHLEYAVMRDGSPVGRHVVDIQSSGGLTDVNINTDVAVKLAFITVYRFEHTDHEKWSGEKLVALNSQTNDNGTYHKLSVSNAGDILKVSVDGEHGTAPAQILPASLWNAETVSQSTLLNTLDGRQMRVIVSDEGEQSVAAKGRTTVAHHYRVSGGLDRELWFDKSNTLVKVSFAADDGSHIVYELQ